MRDYEEKSYYEIQLDNKQLILVFLAAITVCVLIFVLGVMIGKGQKEAELAGVTKNEAPAPLQPEPDTKPPAESLSQIASESHQEKEVKKDQIEPSPKSAVEELDNSEEETPAKETKTEQAKTETPAESTKQEPVAENTTEEKTPAKQEKPRTQFTVQIMATSSRPKAMEQIALLKTKGYTPHLVENKVGSGMVYKVQVGRFTDSADAKELSARLKKDLRIDTWVAVVD